jgi:hypothetical protein
MEACCGLKFSWWDHKGQHLTLNSKTFEHKNAQYNLYKHP